MRFSTSGRARSTGSRRRKKYSSRSRLASKRETLCMTRLVPGPQSFAAPPVIVSGVTLPHQPGSRKIVTSFYAFGQRGSHFSPPRTPAAGGRFDGDDGGQPLPPTPSPKRGGGAGL